MTEACAPEIIALAVPVLSDGESALSHVPQADGVDNTELGNNIYSFRLCHVILWLLQG